MKMIDKEALLKTYKAYRHALEMWRNAETKEVVDGMLSVADQMIEMAEEQIEYERSM